MTGRIGLVACGDYDLQLFLKGFNVSLGDEVGAVELGAALAGSGKVLFLDPALNGRGVDLKSRCDLGNGQCGLVVIVAVVHLGPLWVMQEMQCSQYTMRCESVSNGGRYE